MDLAEDVTTDLTKDLTKDLKKGSSLGLTGQHARHGSLPQDLNEGSSSGSN